MRLVYAVLCLLVSLSAQGAKVVIVTDDDYPPYSFIENGTVKGIYVDLLERAGEILKPHYQIEIIPMPWKRALLKVEQAEVFGVMPPYLHYDSRPYIREYSVSLGTEYVVTYCHDKVELSQALDANLTEQSKLIHIGMNAGYLLLDSRYKAAIKSGRIILWENKSTTANVIKLLTNKIDCYINDKQAIEYELSAVTTKIPGLLRKDLAVKDFLSSKTAHIGFSHKAIKPSTEDFIKRLNDALLKVQNELDNQQLSSE